MANKKKADVEPKSTDKKDEVELHRKPTQEELDEAAEKALKEVEEMEEKGEVDEEEEREEEQEPEEKEEEPKEEPKEDYKEKFVQSSKEALILHTKNKKINEAIDQAITTPEPTEEDLQKEYSDWDVMGDFEKKMAKESLWNSRKFQRLEDMRKDNQELEKWHETVEEFIDDPKNLANNSALENKTEEFRLFASQPTRRGMDFETLVSAFLYDATKNEPIRKKAMFDAGTGGPDVKVKPKSDVLSVDEGRQLMKTDYNRWRQMLKAGKIANE